MSAVPKVPLWPSGGRAGSRARARSAVASSRATPLTAGNCGSMSMSATTSSPQAAAPGKRKWPRFGPAKVTVRSALTASGSSAPLSQFMPLGQSTATMIGCRGRSSSQAGASSGTAGGAATLSSGGCDGAAARRFSAMAAPTCSMMVASCPSIGRVTPVPSRASMMMSVTRRRWRRTRKRWS